MSTIAKMLFLKNFKKYYIGKIYRLDANSNRNENGIGEKS
jgi:hypothetical protein